MAEPDNWQPLESNPEIMNSYCKKLGFETNDLIFQDVFSTDDWALDMVGDNCMGVLLVFPITENYKKDSFPDPVSPEQLPPSMFYMYQTSKNACGTVGVYHIIGNLPEDLKQAALKENSVFSNFFENAKGKSYEEKADDFNNDQELKSKHCEAVEKGKTEIPDSVSNHFVAFVMKDGGLYELDGRKKGPIYYRPTSQESFLKDACAVIKTEYIEKDSENPNFAIIALAGLPT